MGKKLKKNVKIVGNKVYRLEHRGVDYREGGDMEAMKGGKIIHGWNPRKDKVFHTVLAVARREPNRALQAKIVLESDYFLVGPVLPRLGGKKAVKGAGGGTVVRSAR